MNISIIIVCVYVFVLKKIYIDFSNNWNDKKKK